MHSYFKTLPNRINYRTLQIQINSQDSKPDNPQVSLKRTVYPSPLSSRVSSSICALEQGISNKPNSILALLLTNALLGKGLNIDHLGGKLLLGRLLVLAQEGESEDLADRVVVRDELCGLSVRYERLPVTGSSLP